MSVCSLTYMYAIHNVYTNWCCMLSGIHVCYPWCVHYLIWVYALWHTCMLSIMCTLPDMSVCALTCMYAIHNVYTNWCVYALWHTCMLSMMCTRNWRWCVLSEMRVGFLSCVRNTFLHRLRRIVHCAYPTSYTERDTISVTFFVFMVVFLWYHCVYGASVPLYCCLTHT